MKYLTPIYFGRIVSLPENKYKFTALNQKEAKMHEATKRERTQLQEIVDLFKAGNLNRVYVVAQDKDGEISEYDFNSAEADLSSPD